MRVAGLRSGTADLRGGGLRLATPAGDGDTRHPAGASVAQISLLGAAASIVEGHPHDSALSLLHLVGALVTHEDSFSGQDFPPSSVAFGG